MNRFVNNRYCFFASCAVVSMGLFGLVGHAQIAVPRTDGPVQQSRPKQPDIKTNGRHADALKKYDLAVKVKGAIDGNKDFVLTFTITNVGQEAYRGGRYLKVLAVTADRKGTIMQRREPIKQLIMPGESWTPPFPFKVLSRAVPTNHFVLVLTEAGPMNDEDGNITNDWDQIEVTAPLRYHLPLAPGSRLSPAPDPLLQGLRGDGAYWLRLPTARLTSRCFALESAACRTGRRNQVDGAGSNEKSVYIEWIEGAASNEVARARLMQIGRKCSAILHRVRP